jgi:hypothetical protein
LVAARAVDLLREPAPESPGAQQAGDGVEAQPADALGLELGDALAKRGELVQQLSVLSLAEHALRISAASGVAWRRPAGHAES